ncbi:hypothetical protein MPTK1_4g19280 [Marchantia polymorpha subsp. ruderalis]|uniref:Sulfate ABC transporter substrate-binding protein n=2 Tax=Marchantia polymorpha TaxID=3197 RepID=A0AAF6BBJ3_MARPO|nr:hypothetical protein MARPO_0169s0016 [Marchantia polymorpha]BBN09377.1 hypothetical protein Mp_4g19280 [Marchantia polymorpha subsp. ruderalis]|eukprot:PTQ28252.1 hypothetical protein MARPO_0169s0016 [Marchantia polymorpha]
MAFTEHVLQGALSSRICESAVCASGNLKSCGCSCKLTSGSHVVRCKSSSGMEFAKVAEIQRSPLVRTLAIVPVSSQLKAKGSAGSSDANEQKNFKQRKSNDRRSFIGKMTSLSLFSISLGPVFCESAGAASNFWNGSEGNGGNTAKVVKKKPVLITLAAYAVTKVAYEKITHLFAEHWLKEHGQEVKFRLSLAGSGAQARAVIDGLPADVVSLALPLDVLKIEEAGLIDSDWQKRVPNNAVPAETTVCIVTRPGNPKNITDWQDLARSDVSCLTANPKTAGVARWNFLALWGSVTVEGGSEEEAQTLIENVFRNVPVEPRDAREVSDVFYKQGLGDAMITYENEIVLTNEKIVESRGEALPYTIPPVNVRVEMSIAVVDKNARRSGVYEVAEAFVNYCFTEPAQREYAKTGFRPYVQSVAEEFNIIPVEKPWKVEEQVGEWLHVQEKFFADKGMIDVIEQNIRASRLGT